ncbi:MAG TPA: hypothetical protein VMB51_02915 [Solirubrobacteraceae bacterium]|jgi:hypothetical protein|nr:hypothetical protein [Solirubrobacteraceae bacterium]
MNPRGASREQYLVMKERATKAAWSLVRIEDPQMRSNVNEIGRWASGWVQEWEDAHPGQAEPST